MLRYLLAGIGISVMLYGVISAVKDIRMLLSARKTEKLAQNSTQKAEKTEVAI